MIKLRVLVGKMVNVEKPVNLMDMSRLDRIIYSAISGYHNTSFYRRRIAQTEEREEERRRQLRDSLTDGLLSVIYKQLTTNQLLADKNDVCVAVLIEIPVKYVPFIEDVINTKDFIAYEITHIRPNRDAERFSKNLPHLIRIAQRKEVIRI